MTQSKNDKAPAKGGRSSGSSLTDAVVAALAQVEARDKSEPPKDAKSETKPEAKPAETKPAETKPAETKASEVVSEPKPDVVRAEPIKVDGAAQPEAVATLSSKVVDGEPTPAVTVAAAVAVPEAAPAPASDEPVIEQKAEPASESAPSESAPSEPAPSEPAPREAGEADGSPTRPHAVAKVEQVVERGPTPEGLGARYFGKTDVGLVREHNEDNFLVADLSAKRRGVETAILETKIGKNGCVFGVCDGMGGAAAGEVASQMAVDTVFEVMDEGGPPRDRDDFARRLVRAIEEAGARIFAAAKMDRTRRGMGTTATVAGLIDSTLFVGQVGDSRAYVLRGDQFALITKDQSLVNQLIEAGQLTEEEAEAFEHSNIILQALGTTEEVTVDLTFLELRRGDRLLLCSDGLSGLVHADMMKEVLSSAPSLADAASQLIAMANSGGGHDNITVVLVEFDGTELKEATKDARVAYQQYPLPPAPVDEPKLPSRAPQMKSGGAKPGADVKKSHSSAPRPAARLEADTGGSPLVWIGATVMIILVLVAIAWAISGSGSSEEPPRPVVGRTAPAPEPEGTLAITTDIEGAELWINGARHGALESASRVTLAPGAYHLEARSGSTRIAEATVAIAADETRDVRLEMPTLAPEALAPPSVEVDRSVPTTGEEPPALVVEAPAVEAPAVEAPAVEAVEAPEPGAAAAPE